eukprot:CAMPEP_0170451590 /NCGR_PEP_ID=MMETSP0123-20130129/778_1 /TAXON_ID=182087 /ORGANISM="Favella ehrenbergii, Strain Fehren 1" /LENGTH=77 /DNA_ID=CAMNT_0010713327 /DNA_START=154 /DNA_END=387 /DNA_ORIENTATION=+
MQQQLLREAAEAEQDDEQSSGGFDGDEGEQESHQSTARSGLEGGPPGYQKDAKPLVSNQEIDPAFVIARAERNIQNL